MGLFSSIGEAFGARKGEKTARRAAGQSQQDFLAAYGGAQNALSAFLPAVTQTSDTARTGIQNYLQNIANENYSVSPEVLAAINEQETQQNELAAAQGKFSSGGLQGELSKLRTNAILGDYNNRFTNNLNALRTLAPFAQEAQGLQGTITGLGIDRAKDIAASRQGYVNQAIPAFKSLGKSLGNAADQAVAAFATGGMSLAAPNMNGGSR